MSDTQRRFAVLRDLDTPDREPLGVLFELSGGGAVLFVFGDSAEKARLRREFEDFDRAVELWSRSALVSHVGVEGQS